MVALKISAFAGERPIVIPRLLPETAAQSAVNLRLNDGGLTPINKSSKIDTISDASHASIYKHQGTWLSWPGLVNASPGPVAADRLYYTGDGVPKARIGGTVYPLAVPRPVSAINGVVSGVGSGSVYSRTYVYTQVTSFGEESAPCPAGNVVDWQTGQTVTLSGFLAAPGGRSITKQRIYRSQTGTAGTFYYFIAERAASNAAFVDTVAVDAFQEALPSQNWDPPPDTLSGLISMPNGMMAAFTGRDVYFCEPFRPHAWPESYVMSVDSDIVGLGSVGSYLVVMTNGFPVIMAGSHPSSMQATKLEANFPCVNARSIVDLGFAICYASNDGLVAVRGDGSIQLATEQLFSREMWLALSPTTLVGAVVNGNYVLFYNTVDALSQPYSGGIFININATPFIVRISDVAQCVFFDISLSALYYKSTGDANIYRLDDPNAVPATYSWKSKEFRLSAPINFSALIVDSGAPSSLKNLAALNAEIEAINASNIALLAAGSVLGEVNTLPLNEIKIGGDILAPLPANNFSLVTATIYADNEVVASTSVIDQIVRLPGGFRAREWEILISGNVQITQVIIAETVEEIKQVM